MSHAEPTLGTRRQMSQLSDKFLIRCKPTVAASPNPLPSACGQLSSGSQSGGEIVVFAAAVATANRDRSKASADDNFLHADGSD
mmetsp:Transcript_4761/g.9348  ORF Transcript_4761/g.9348 Transcript_4761/m.9348 type:complete len:84 (-) Transcript_4761:78-329(-)